MLLSTIGSSSKKVQFVMDQLPVEVIGNILSHLGDARHIVIASAVCHKWREAWKNHVHTLSFDSKVTPIYTELTTSSLEILITETIFQTNGLRCLSILMHNYVEFSAPTVISWLMYTRKTLRELHFDLFTTPNVNILEKCGRHQLEVLSVENSSIRVAEPSYQKFTCLKCLSLSSITIPVLDLSLALAACPVIEFLELLCLDIVISDADAETKLSSCSLKSLCVNATCTNNFKLTFEAHNLEKLHVTCVTLSLFVLAGKGNLKILRVDDVTMDSLDIGEETKNLEVVDISYATISWSSFYNRIKRSSNIKKLCLREVDLFVEDDKDDILDLGMITICFPRLSYLSLNCDFVKRDFLHNDFGENQACLENVVVLELGGTIKADLPELIEGILEKCPSLRKLLIYGITSHITTQADYRRLSIFTSSVIQLMRKYMQVQVSLQFGEGHSSNDRWCTSLQ